MYCFIVQGALNYNSSYKYGNIFSTLSHHTNMSQPKHPSTRYPYDEVYKNIFSHRQAMQDLLTGFVDEPWVKKLALSTLTLSKDSFVSHTLRRRDEDLVWEVKWQGQTAYLYLLLGFQSQIDAFMAVRCLAYTSLDYQNLIKSQGLKKGDKLPPIIPIVIYNGEAVWDAALDVHSLVEPLAGLEQYCPQIKYLLLDIKQLANKVGLDKHNLMTAVIELENSQSIEAIMGVVGRLVDLLKDPQHLSLREAFFVWLSRIVIPKQLPAGTQVPHISDLKEVNAMLADRIQQWYLDYEKKGLEAGMKQGLERGLQEGLQEGLEKGLEAGMKKGKAEGMIEGKAEGIAEGKAETLLQLLTMRFGEQSTAVHEQVMHMSETQITACITVIFEATSVETVLQQAELPEAR